MTDTQKIDRLLDFWFGDTLEQTTTNGRRLWFHSTPEDDATIEALFSDDVEAASAGRLDSWADTARGRLALIVLLDQFPRCLYRGSAEAFARDPIALSLTLEGMDRGHDSALHPLERAFFYMPMQHSESLDTQKRSVETFTILAEDAPPTLRELCRGYLKYARLHCEIIRRFGRFPHRNKALGRPSTPEESAYLDGDAPTFGQR